MNIHITPATFGDGKLADVELRFTDGPLAGLRLIGFAIWHRNGARAVTFPSRSYKVLGESRSFALLRPTDAVAAQDRLSGAILSAYADFESKETK